jgi:hypothetical protein
MRKTALVILVAFSLVILAGCEMETSTKPQTSATGATQATIDKIPKNSKGNTCEQQNILDRIRVTTDPAKVMWIHLISLDGKILKRMPVRNKVTSSGKRLEPSHAIAFAASGNGKYGKYPEYKGYMTPELIEPDGTYGSSDPYIFWFDPMSRYHQWGTAGGLGYLITDYPIDLENPMDKVTGLYNADHAASKWQAEQEEKLRVSEGKK